MPDRDFAEVQAELERIIVILKGTKDPKRRRELLREMSRLVGEADRHNIEADKK